MFVSHFALHVYKAGAFLMKEVAKLEKTDGVQRRGERREKEEEEEGNESLLGVNDHQDAKQTRSTERSSEYMYKKALLLVSKVISRV